MISVLITVGLLGGDRRDPVLRAVRENLANPGVRDVHVLSEAPLDWLIEAMGSAGDRLHAHPVVKRPLFSEMFAFGNRLLAARAGTVAMMNADISIATADDVLRILDTFDDLSNLSEPVVLALTRHEADGVQPRITLYDGCGLPNFLSADCWVYQQPILVTRELFYAPGEMNCDMFLAHDLINAGCRLFNPCLDIVLRHHEAAKDDAFYATKVSEESVQTMLWKHVVQNNVDPFNYFGIPWTRSTWVRQGYRPRPLSTNGRRLMLCVPAGEEEGLGRQLEKLAEMGCAHGFELQIVCDGDLDRLVHSNITQLVRLPEIVVSRPKESLASLRRGMLAGTQYMFKSLAFLGCLSHVTPALLAIADGVLVGLGETDSPAEVPVGCTLITSVFRSDPFIRGFINNSLALVGYDRLIDHVFLVSNASEIEVTVLGNLLARKPNVLVLWHQTDPGLYQCWNLGIRLARRSYVSNANVDDLRDPMQVLTLIRDLEMHPEACVAATAMNPFYDYPEDGRLPEERAAWYSDQAGTFGFFDIARLSNGNPPTLIPHNMPHCMPVWRRSLHDRYGWFEELDYGTYADWAFWLKVLQDGAVGWMERAPLSFYFVNPDSHNRRGTDLERLHRVVEDEYLGAFLARENDAPSFTSRSMPHPVRKLNLTGRDQAFGQHRNDFTRLITALDPLDRGDGLGCRVIPFLERYFVWGDGPGEANSGDARPISEDWIGILHVPFDAPDWFDSAVSPENLFATQLWQQSRPYCRGIITLCADLEVDLRAYDPGLATLSVPHPTELEVRMFDFDAYLTRPRVVQVGDWLRKLQAIHRLRASAHERVMLLKQWTENYLQHDIQVFGDHRDPGVIVRRTVPNEEYDELLSSSVVLCLMYATAANNVVVECIARATPLLINPLPGAVEYLGPDYPLYAADEVEAGALLACPTRIRAAHNYLLQRRKEIDLTYSGFCRNIALSEFYARL